MLIDTDFSKSAGQLFYFPLSGPDMIIKLVWNLLENSVRSNIRSRAQILTNTKYGKESI